MKDQSSTTQKVCSFYVSNMHFATMILPFVNKQIEAQTKIVTFFENNFTTNIELVLSRLTIKEENKKKLLEINWKNTDIMKYPDIEKVLKNNILKNQKNIIIINGSDEYINVVNNCLNRYMVKNYKRINQDNIKIMDFYEMRKL